MAQYTYVGRPFFSQKSARNLDFSSSFLQKVLTPELELTSVFWGEEILGLGN
jgi:hypothetical protein